MLDHHDEIRQAMIRQIARQAEFKKLREQLNALAWLVMLFAVAAMSLWLSVTPAISIEYTDEDERLLRGIQAASWLAYQQELQAEKVGCEAKEHVQPLTSKELERCKFVEQELDNDEH